MKHHSPPCDVRYCYRLVLNQLRVSDKYYDMRQLWYRFAIGFSGCFISLSDYSIEMLEYLFTSSEFVAMYLADFPGAQT